MKNIADRIKEGLALRDMKQSDLVRLTGIGKSSISTYISGAYEPKQRNIYKIAKALNVSESWLMGYDVPYTREPIEGSSKYNIIPLPSTRQVPLLGRIACGDPILAIETTDEYVAMPDTIRANFALTCEGESMINARILDGDIVYIHQQDDVENGEIAAVIIEDEATLKRVYKDPEREQLTLMPENPAYPPLVYRGEELDHIRIIGKVVAFYSPNVK